MRRRVVALSGLCLMLLLGVPAAGSARPPSAGASPQIADFPWLARIANGGCEGALVSPDRVVTTAGCAELIEGTGIRIGNVRRRIAGVALPPAVVTRLAAEQRSACDPDLQDGTTCSPDVAVLRLSAPIGGVAPLRLTARQVGWESTIVSYGRVDVADEIPPARLRTARLRVMADARCRADLRRLDLESDFHPQWPHTFCARYPRRPRNPGVCVGGGGAPLVTLRRARAQLLGIDSYGSACDLGVGLTVFADVWPLRAFIGQSALTWRPSSSGDVRLSGIGRVGQILTCHAPRLEGQVDRIEFWFGTETFEARTFQRGPASSYVIREQDVGEEIACRVIAWNAGGPWVGMATPGIPVA